MSTSMIRAMALDDLPDVSWVTKAAFGRLHAQASSAAPAGPMAPPLFFAVRLAADPGGCFIAVPEQDPSRVAGALLSCARGTLGWLGPFAVHPDAQRSGVGGQLVAACLDSWRRRGVRLMGLETFRDSQRAAGTHRCHVVSELDGHADVMGDKWDRLTQFALQAQELGLQALADYRLDRAERLAQQHGGSAASVRVMPCQRKNTCGGLVNGGRR
jgi:predicted N-acetyltransferase YhbS